MAGFQNVAFDTTIDTAEELLERSLSRIALIEVDPFLRETTPVFDMSAAQALAHLVPHGLAPLTARGLCRAARSASRDWGFADIFMDRLSEFRRLYDSDDAFRCRVDRARRNRPGSRLGAAAALVDVYLRDLNLGLTRNDAWDFLHATVPLVFCDLVVLDKKWAEIARQAARRLPWLATALPVSQIGELPQRIRADGP